MSKHVWCLFLDPTLPSSSSGSSHRHAAMRVPRKNRLGRCRCSSVLRWTLRLSEQAPQVWLHIARSPITASQSSSSKPEIASEVAHLPGTYRTESCLTLAVNGFIRQI